MPKDALTTVRLNEEDAAFAKQQVAIANALAADSYRREVTLADMFRLLFVKARKRYEVAMAGMSRENVMPFMEFCEMENPQFRANEENQENRQNHEFPRLLKAAGEGVATSGTGRSVNVTGLRGPLRRLALTPPVEEAKAGMALYITPFFIKRIA